MIRLQKYIADAGITSRRKAEDLITQGRVHVNGIRVMELGSKVCDENDVVEVDGNPVDRNRVEKLYLLLNKPRGYVTTLSDPEGRKTVMDLVKECPERIYPVGRLDYLSEGLLLLTNDGELANNIIHPSTGITKVYEVKVFGAVGEHILKKLRAGVDTDVGFLKPKSVRIIKQLHAKTWVEFRLSDGKNREIRKICEACGLTVDKLKRVSIGGLSVDGIKPGSYRFVTKRNLLKEIGIMTNGEIDTTKEYWSRKKTVNIKVKGAQNASSADDKSFWKFRRETYFDTVKDLKERKILEAKKKKDEEYRIKEEEHQKRKINKKKRMEKKELEKKGVHAILLP